LPHTRQLQEKKLLQQQLPLLHVSSFRQKTCLIPQDRIFGPQRDVKTNQSLSQ